MVGTSSLVPRLISYGESPWSKLVCGIWYVSDQNGGSIDKLSSLSPPPPHPRQEEVLTWQIIICGKPLKLKVNLLNTVVEVLLLSQLIYVVIFHIQISCPSAVLLLENVCFMN